MIYLWNDTCIDRLSDVSFIDVMICDPPYSEHVHKAAVSQSPGRGVRKRDMGFNHLSNDLADTIAQFAANVRRWSLIYSDIESLDSWRNKCIGAGASYIRATPWVRWSMPQLSGDRPPSGCEMVSLFWGSQKGRKAWNGPGNLTHYDHKCLRGEDKQKAEKPLDQALDLVSWFSNEGDNVFDPTMGHGTIGLACRLLGRNFYGIELDPVWFERAYNRINVPTLTERDQDRYARWLASSAVRREEMERVAANTNRVRARLDAART